MRATCYVLALPQPCPVEEEVQAFAVARLADFERGGDVDFDEGAVLFDQFAHRMAGATDTQQI